MSEPALSASQEIPPVEDTSVATSKNALKKKAKEEEKAKRAAERKKKEEEAKAAKAAADSIVRIYYPNVDLIRLIR